MEPGGNEHSTVRVGEQSILGRLRLFRDRLVPKEIRPLLWEEWKQTIIKNRQNGIPEGTAPQRFSAGKSLLDTFQEMLPVKYPSAIDDKLFPDAASIAKKKLEVARAMVLDESRTRLLVQAKNGGESKLYERGRMVTRDRVKDEIGGLHTHPSNNLPSSTDTVLLLLRNGNVTEFVVTPWRVIALFRTSQTLTLSNSLVADGYLKAMGKNKGRPLDNSGTWTLKYKDLNELHILAYEAERGKEVFVRKDKAR